MKFLSNEANLALIYLAKRRDNSVTYWYEIHPNCDFCLICLKKLSIAFEQTITHGIQHLREHGLLAFL